MSVNINDDPFSHFIKTLYYSDVCEPSDLIFSVLSQQYIPAGFGEGGKVSNKILLLMIN